MEVSAVWILRMLLILVLVIAVTGFAMMNSAERATVSLGTMAFYDVPLVILLFEAFVLGAVVWFLVSIFHEVTLRRMIRRQKREISDLTQEISGLRNMSLEDIEDDEPSDRF